MSDDLKERVRKKYAGLAVAAQEGDNASCCGPSCGCGTPTDGAATSVIVYLAHGSYTEAERGELPQAAVGASLGCGNPTALATLSPGEVVLDLGSGGGIDVLLSARPAPPRGVVPGVAVRHALLPRAATHQDRGVLAKPALTESDSR